MTSPPPVDGTGTPRTVVVTGASSGIGAALARHWAGPGRTLGLVARDGVRLDAVAQGCRQRGADVQAVTLDVRDRAGMATWLRRFDEAHTVDLVVANAGVMAGTPPGAAIEPADEAYAALETNVLGMANTVQPLLPAMVARRRGQIALMGSLAGFLPLPDAPSYSAAKAAVLSYGRSLRTLLAPHGVRISVICPGYVTTPLLARESGRKPFEMSAERAAGIIARGLARDRGLIAFPFMFSLAARLHGVLPDPLRTWLMAGTRFTVTPETDQPGTGC